MYDIIKNIIQNGVFKVSDLTTKIDTLWAESKLSDEQRNELVQMMTDFLNPSTEAPELKDLYERLESRVSVLEDAVKKFRAVAQKNREQVKSSFLRGFCGMASQAIISMAQL